jgi:putative serine protease PepD
MVTDTPGPDESPTGPAGVPEAEERSPWARPLPDDRWDRPERGPDHRIGHTRVHISEYATVPAMPVPYGYGHGPGQADGGRTNDGRANGEGGGRAAAGDVAPGPHAPDPHPPDARGWPEPLVVPPPFGVGPAPAPLRPRFVVLGLAAVLLAGLVGGVVGHDIAEDSGSGGSPGVLADPLPDIAAVSAPEGPVEAVAARVLPSVVQLRVEGAGSSGEGSAMVLSTDGLLLTNNHVVEAAADAGRVTAVFQDGSTAPARIVGRDPNSDLALVRAQDVSGLVPVELGNSESVRVGQPVVAFGSPLGLGGTVTTGIISAVDRAVSVGPQQGVDTPTVLNALQTDAAINPGNSGGPLVDMEGRVVGINSAIATTGEQGGSIGVGFSIPINQARRVADELQRTGHASRAVLGVTVADDPSRPGALIRSVAPDGAAAQAGIREGDLVIRLGDQRISTGTDLQAAVGSRAPGEAVDVVLADRTVRATLTEAPR